MKWECVNCGRELNEAPTELGNMDCGPHGKICFECIDLMHECLQKWRNSQDNIEQNDSADKKPVDGAQPCGETNTTKATIALCDVRKVLEKGKCFMTIGVDTLMAEMEKIAQQ